MHETRERSEADHRSPFAGTLRLGEDYRALDTARVQGAAGELPSRLPARFTATR